ncbi:universal stress protein [Streptomyces sp. NPDC050121]|uniref:universal stress protein n=1 Tax=Streptomyces sp. NPDC050121 TaxID=3365601 RepID=UPI0037B2740F
MRGLTRPVVAGLDGSKESLAAADWAAREALRRGLTLRLVHAWEGLPDDGADAGLPEIRVPQYHARRVLRAARELLNDRYPGLCIAAEQVHGQPRPALLAEAKDAELLDIGSQETGGVGGPCDDVLDFAFREAELRGCAARRLRLARAVVVRENLHEGRAPHVLVRAAGGAGLLVVGRRRRAALGLHTGPVAHALLHHVRRPVALVPHD